MILFSVCENVETATLSPAQRRNNLDENRRWNES